MLTTTPNIYIPKKGTSIHRKQEVIHPAMPAKGKVLRHGAVRSPKPGLKLFSLQDHQKQVGGRRETKTEVLTSELKR